MNKSTSESLYQEACTYFPGGVNSPVRAFKSVNGNPIFFKEGKGAEVTDVDGNTFVDFCGSWGPLILGHAREEVVEAVINTAKKGMSFGVPTQEENHLGSLILKDNPFIDRIRFTSSGTEAVMSAIRLARGYTKKDKIIKFEGCYHGHVDHLLVQAGSGLATLGTSSSAGVPEAFAAETIVLPLNDEESVKQAFEEFREEIAAIIIEPIPANNGLLLQRREYLEFLINIAHENCALMIFDEVINGFRVGKYGAAGHYNLKPDIITYGKIIGGGMPVGAFAAKQGIMSYMAPEGPVYQAGTLSGNPVAMAAGAAQLSICFEEGFYERLEKNTKEFIGIINARLEDENINAEVISIGSIFWIKLTKEIIRTADQIDPASMDIFKEMYDVLLEKGVYIGPSGYEVGFISDAHTAEKINSAANIIAEALISASKK